MPIAAPIEIIVTNVQSAKGHIRIEVCTAAQFLKDCTYSASAPARNGTVILTVPSVPPGRYAIQAGHDENDNRKIDRNLFGIPKEGVGFSRDVRICMAAPRFADAAFDHGADPQSLRFSIHYRLCDKD